MKRRRSAQKPRPAELPTLTLDPNAVFQVRLLETPKSPAPLKPRLQMLVLIALSIFIPCALFWFYYVNPRVFPLPHEIGVGNLSISLAHPVYIVRGDGAEIDVTVTNRGVDPVSGSLVMVFTGAAQVRPLAAAKTSIKLEDLPGGASVTEQVKIDITPQATRSDLVIVSLQGKAGGQSIPMRQVSQMAVMPAPYLRTITNGLLKLIFIGIITSVGAMLWEEVIKKRMLGVGKD